MMPHYPSKWAPWELTQFSQLPSAAPSYFPESYWWSKISSLSKVILILGKAKSRRAPNLGYRGVESPRWFDVSPKNFARHWEWAHWAGTLLWWSCQSAVAHSCSLLNHPNSFHRGMSKLNAKLDTDHCSTHSVILNVMVTQYTWLFNLSTAPTN